VQSIYTSWQSKESQSTTALLELLAVKVRSHSRILLNLSNKSFAGHLATLDYIYTTLAELGDYYEISNQSFNAVVGNVFEWRLVLGDTEPDSVLPFALSPPTPKKDAVFGPLVLVANDGCDKSDYPANTKGAVALIKRGVCPFGQKSELAGRAGAIAAVIYNYEKGSMSGTLGQPSAFQVATFGISKEDAKPYIEKLKHGKMIPSSAYMDSIVSNAPTTNIVAQTKGGDPENCIMLGGHSDSVAAGGTWHQ
jgi:aminopeptidase Y